MRTLKELPGLIEITIGTLTIGIVSIWDVLRFGFNDMGNTFLIGYKGVCVILLSTLLILYGVYKVVKYFD